MLRQTLPARFFAIASVAFWSASVRSFPALFPEDGSEILGYWHTHRDFDASEKLEEVLAADGIGFKRLDVGYEWLHDLAAFDVTGQLVLQAHYPDDAEALAGLTLGAGGIDDPKLLRLSEDKVRKFGYQHRTQSHSLWEGGALITGRFEDGSPYAIIDGSVLDRLRYVSKPLGLAPHSDAHLTNWIAEDLAVLPANLFLVRPPRHLDLVMTALPGGRLVIEDQRLVVPTLERILKQTNIAQEEKQRLTRMLDVYKNGFYRVFGNGSRAEYPDHARSEATDRVVDALAESLGHRFQITRAPGTFIEPGAWQLKDEINFYNGFMALGKTRLRQITNTGRNLVALEKEWQRVLQSVEPRITVEFVGEYYREAGLDCSGLPGPARSYE